MAIFGEFALVGAPGAPYNNSTGFENNVGVVYVYQNAGLVWNWVETILRGETTIGRFGQSVSLYSNYALIGVPKDSERGVDAGAIYIFQRVNPNLWIIGKRLLAIDAQTGDEFGSSVSIFGRYFVSSAPGDDDLGKDAGAVDSNLVVVGAEIAEGNVDSSGVIYIFSPEGEVVSVGEDNAFSPETFALSQNHPNPFNPSTTISYRLSQADKVNVAIYNQLGQALRILVDKQQNAGAYKIAWDGRNDHGENMPSGIYLNRLRAGAFSQTRKMLLIR